MRGISQFLLWINPYSLIDQSVIKKCKSKDQKAFKRLYEGTLPYVLKIIRSYIPDPEQQKDTVQEVYSKVFLNLVSFDSEKGAFKVWLRSIVLNECRLVFRKNSQQSLPSKEIFDNVDNEGAKRMEKVSQERLSHVRKAMKKMPCGYSKIIELTVFEGYSHKEVAQILGISESTSRSQFLRAKRWLSAHFNQSESISKL